MCISCTVQKPTNAVRCLYCATRLQRGQGSDESQSAALAAHHIVHSSHMIIPGSFIVLEGCPKCLTPCYGSGCLRKMIADGFLER